MPAAVLATCDIETVQNVPRGPRSYRAVCTAHGIVGALRSHSERAGLDAREHMRLEHSSAPRAVDRGRLSLANALENAYPTPAPDWVVTLAWEEHEERTVPAEQRRSPIDPFGDVTKILMNGRWYHPAWYEMSHNARRHAATAFSTWASPRDKEREIQWFAACYRTDPRTARRLARTVFLRQRRRTAAHERRDLIGRLTRWHKGCMKDGRCLCHHLPALPDQP
ncbi:hypothetical protein ACFC1T_09215 [Kitasatospora sp. NPDC056076]|uniref:hypothetical protein n=1 Tax=Kitasatospora sp. NPDC056076 TaxID=3345703 RepID=UPI0035DBC1A3